MNNRISSVASGEVTSDTVKAQLKRHLEMWKGKPLRGYLPTKIEKDKEIDDIATAEWMNTSLSSHVEDYTATLQEQEIATQATIKRRTKDGNLPLKCRLCEDKDETVFHVLCSCPKLSTNLYTTARHDHVGEVLLNEIIKDQQHQRTKNPPPISMTPTREIWWNKLITTTSRVKHNRPDIVIWDKKASVCTVIEIGVPLIPMLQSVKPKKETNTCRWSQSFSKCIQASNIKLYQSLLGHLELYQRNLKNIF